MRFGKYYVDAISDYGIERTDQNGNGVICSGFYCRVFDDPEYKNEVDDFCLAVGYEIEEESQEALENGIRRYLGMESAMSEKRMVELLGNFIGWFLDHQTSDEGLFRDLHVEIGMTKEELHNFSIESLDEMFDQAEKEHRKEVDETTDMITAEDVVEQAVYMANAPDCCADEHAENMLGMLGANIVEPEIYHDEDECPRREVETEEESIDYKKAVIESVEAEFAQFESEMIDGKTAEDVFANNYQIYVKSQIMHTICEEMEFDDEVYKALYEDRGSILKNLHEEFISQPEASVNSRGDVAELIEDYCNTYHGEIMDEASSLALSM